MEQYDILIVGAGMVGAASACALAQKGFSVAIVEAQTPQPFAPEQPRDLRVSAISAASEQLLSQLGAWSAIDAMRTAPYQTLATWEWQRSEVRFEASEIGCDHLGHIIENRVVQLGLWQAMAELDGITLLTGQGPDRIWQDEAGAYLQVGERRLQGRLLMGCDGARSRVRAATGIGLTGWQYRHHCLAVNITTEAPQQTITWQEFTPSGPRAFLPLAGHHGSLVWYDSPEKVAQLMRLEDGELKRAIQQAFPERLGAFEIDGRGSFPLTRQHAQHYFDGRLVLLGDAAHTINPLAGQGVNLGFKDVATLAQVLVEAKDSGQSWDSEAVLMRYQTPRRRDNLLMQSTMDLFYTLFSNDRLPLKLARNLGLMAAQNAGPVKNQVMRYAMGL
ncbi:FAD-dependent oxidoreductase [Ferrimonas balearica]|uniref:FAD-dependent oxidoreductase n=1 Tax=Ferrimonas balearica TaxID=44012 RepID=UPI001C995CA1|nr:FAD-dependent oxidoreductase [Ferrimonas balearica]MBY5992732.1 FAD-dependent monooxygenase [Ferrimonas balearica]